MGTENISVPAFLIKRGDFSGASDICDFLSLMVSSSSYSKRANAIRPYNNIIAPKISSRYFDQIEPITPMTSTFLISKKPQDIIRQGF